MNHSRHYTTARLGRWLPAEPKHLNDWLTKAIEAAEQKKAPFHPVVEEFRAMIENDPEMYMYFTQMFEQQAPFAPPIGSGDIKLKNYYQMLVVLNHVLTSAPEFNTTGMVGCPINAVLDFPMITRAGLAAFLSPKVNAMLKKVLKVWTEYLDSPASRYVLNSSENGWLCPAALKALQWTISFTIPKLLILASCPGTRLCEGQAVSKASERSRNGADEWDAPRVPLSRRGCGPTCINSAIGDSATMERTPPGPSKSKEMDKKNNQIAHRRIVAGREILRKYWQNSNSPATGQSEKKLDQSSVRDIRVSGKRV